MDSIPPSDLDYTAKCRKCAEDNELPAKYYCLDCESLFCDECSGHIHRGRDIDHVLEVVVEDTSNRGVHFITPLVDEVFFAGLLYFLFINVQISADYFSVRKYCPLLNHVRSWMAAIDTGAVQVYTSELHVTCAVEDGFYRFHADAWLRSVVTNRDSAIMLFTSACPVYFAEMTVTWAMIPVISFVYAALLTIIYWLEAWLPRIKPLVKLEEFCKELSVFDLDDEIPPITLWRMSRAKGPLDWFTYRIDRRIRIPRLYYKSISERLESIAGNTFNFALAVRLTCIFFGIYWLFVLFVLVGFVAWLHEWFTVPDFEQLQAWFVSSRSGRVRYGRCLSAGVIGIFVLPFSFWEMYRRFQYHRQVFGYFADTDSNPEFSEIVFWHIITGVVKLDKYMTTVLLGAIVTVVTVGMAALPSIWAWTEPQLRRLSTAHIKKT